MTFAGSVDYVASARWRAGQTRAWHSLWKVSPAGEGSFDADAMRAFSFSTTIIGSYMPITSPHHPQKGLCSSMRSRRYAYPAVGGP